MKNNEQQSQLEYIKHSRNEIHSYSKGVAKLFDLAVSYVYDAEEAHRKGKNAVWTMGLWEVPLIYACDALPVSITELGRLGSQGSITVAEDYFQVPRESCSMVTAILGEWHLRKESGIKRALGFCGFCEPLNVAWELAKKEGYDVYEMDAVYLPPKCDAARYEEMVRFFAEELRGAAKWIKGSELDEEKLDLEIRRRNEILGKLRRVMDLRLKHPLYIKSLPTMFLLMGSGHYFGKPLEYLEVLNLLIDELEWLGDDLTPSKITPLVWAGGRGQEFGVYKAIDDAGGAILGWMTPNAFVKDYRLDVPPLESVARYVLEGQMAGASVYRRKYLEDQVNKTDAKGLVLYGYMGCSFGGIERELERNHFHKKGIPSISLEGTFQVGPPSGQLLTRVRAFVEMFS